MARRWLARFTDPFTVSETAAFRVLGARDPVSDRRVTLIVARAGVDRTLADAALARLFRAHTDPPHAAIARALERVDEPEGSAVVLDFAVSLDLDSFVQKGVELGWRLGLDAADGFSSALRRPMMVMAETIDAETGAPRCLGTLALGNVLLAADGSHALIGYGHNVICCDEHGRHAPRGRFFQAPEVTGGATPTASSDYIAMVRMSRTMITFVRLPESLARIMRGAPAPEDRELFEVLARFEMTAVQSSPGLRPPIPEMLAMTSEIRRLLAIREDEEAFREEVRRFIVEAELDRQARRTLRLARDFAWIATEGEPLSVSPRLRRILQLLAGAHRDRPGQPIDSDALIEGAWPEERISPTSAKNRLHVALSSLRKLGIGDALELEGSGYRLSPSVRIELVDDPERR